MIVLTHRVINLVLKNLSLQNGSIKLYARFMIKTQKLSTNTPGKY